MDISHGSLEKCRYLDTVSSCLICWLNICCICPLPEPMMRSLRHTHEKMTTTICSDDDIFWQCYRKYSQRITLVKIATLYDFWADWKSESSSWVIVTFHATCLKKVGAVESEMSPARLYCTPHRWCKGISLPSAVNEVSWNYTYLIRLFVKSLCKSNPRDNSYRCKSSGWFKSEITICFASSWSKVVDSFGT